MINRMGWQMISKKCPNCNAPLVYRDERQDYFCEYCKAEFGDENAVKTAEAEPEKKVIYEYRHVSVPDQSSLQQQAAARKKNPGCSRSVYITAGAILVLLAAGGYSNGDYVMASIVLGLGIWFLVLGSRRNK